MPRPPAALAGIGWRGFARSGSSVFLAMTLLTISAIAEETPPPAGNDVPKTNASANPNETLKITPAAVVLRGPDAVQQIVVEVVTPNPEPNDRTDKASYESRPQSRDR